MARVTEHAGLALRVAVVGGLLLGTREGLLTFEANAFVQPGQYLFVYLAVPILAWIGLSMALLLPLAAIVGGRARHSAPGAWLWLYASALGFLGALSIIVPSVADAAARMRAVGLPHGLTSSGVLWGTTLVLAAGLAAVVGAAAAWYGARSKTPLRLSARVAAVVGLLCLAPVARFIHGDWKWGTATSEARIAQSQRPNVLLVSIDTLRADHLGIYGNPRGLTPHLDRLGNQGVVFERTVTSSPWTLPAVASLLTGLYPRHHGAGAIVNRRDPLGRSTLAPGSWTLALGLREHGYRTHAVVTNPYLALRYGLGEGFHGYENVTIESEAFLAFGQTAIVRAFNWLLPDFVIGDRGETVSARAIQWLDGQSGGQPFFLWLHYVDPHPPYNRAHASRHKSFRADSLFAPSTGSDLDLTLTSPDVARLRSGEIRLNAEEKEAVHALYRTEVASVDDAVGAVLDALERRGLSTDTLVVVVADHGEEFWEHGGVEHGHTVYEEVVRVPLLMRWPGHLPGRTRVESLARITDVAPTILDLLEMPPPREVDGESLVPIIHGAPAPPRVALIENMLFAEERTGLRLQDHKYVRWENGKEELYDLDADPRERRDLAAVDAAAHPVRQLFAAVDGAHGPQPPSSDQPPVNSAMLEGLRALGYVQ